MNNLQDETSEQRIGRLIGELNSLHDGDLAVERLLTCGKSAIPKLAEFLLNNPPRSISQPRCRAVRALGELGAYSALIAYFKNYARPQDSVVLFAEDAVRSAAARELARHASPETFFVLLEAAWQRVTSGLILALSEFHRLESVPLFFHVLEDDLCREDAMNCLRKFPDAIRQFGVLTIRGLTNVTIDGPSAARRRRAALQLLSEVGVVSGDWPHVRRFLSVTDPAVVVSAVKIGFAVTSEAEWPELVFALFKVASQFDSLLESDAEEVLDSHPRIAREIALQIARQKQLTAESPDWMSPYWRILNHASGRALENHQARAS